MGTTPNLKLPFPELTDVLDGPDAISDLASATEDYFYNRNLPAGVVRAPSYHWGAGTDYPVAGVRVGDTFVRSDLGQALMRWNGTAWRQTETVELLLAQRLALGAGSLPKGFHVLETDTRRIVRWDGTKWQLAGGTVPLVTVARGSNGAFPQVNVWTGFGWDITTPDTTDASMFNSANFTRLVAPFDGSYQATFQTGFGGGAGPRYLGLRATTAAGVRLKRGTSRPLTGSDSATEMLTTSAFRLLAGEYVECMYYSGVSSDYAPYNAASTELGPWAELRWTGNI